MAYRARDAIAAPDARAMVHRFGMLAPIAVVDGKVVGTWARTPPRAGTTAITITAVADLSRADQRALEAAGVRYAAFIGAHATVAFAPNSRRRRLATRTPFACRTRV